MNHIDLAKTHGTETPAVAALPESDLKRIAFLGDSITDGYTYPQLVRDSLAKSKHISAVAINAGIGGDTMPAMFSRVQRDVLDHNPTLVTISSGGNDAARGVTAAEYEAAMRQTVAVLQINNIPVILLTPCGRQARHPINSIIDEYEAAVRRIASDCNLRIAEVGRQMSADAVAGKRQHSLDGHPGYTGQKSIARAVLDAMGFADVPVVDRVDAVMDKDVIREWRIRPVGESEQPLTDDEVSKLIPDDSWSSVTLPFRQTDYSDSDFESLAWIDDLRQEGMAVQLAKNVATGKRFVSVSTISEGHARTAILQTGAEVIAVWLNGRKVFVNEWLHGWHFGRDATEVTLNAGSNILVVESGENFWVRLGSEPIW